MVRVFVCVPGRDGRERDPEEEMKGLLKVLRIKASITLVAWDHARTLLHPRPAAGYEDGEKRDYDPHLHVDEGYLERSLVFCHLALLV